VPGQGVPVTGPSAPVAVVGQIGRDLVLAVDELPGPGGSTPVRRRREVLGGKSANQAVALVQLGRPAALVGVLGDDRAGDAVLARAAADGVDAGAVVRRAGAASALLVDVVEPHGVRRLLEDVAPEVLLSADDVVAAGSVLGRAAPDHRPVGVLTVADGAPPDERAVLTAALLPGADPRTAAWEAAAAASLTVARAGDRPALRAAEVTRPGERSAHRLGSAT